MNHSNAVHPYAELTPDRVMDALTELGLWPDGRLLALSSYENRVYRAHLDEPVQDATAVVLKFYRPGRWSREQIQEEHLFAAELVAAEVPVVAPMVLNGKTLHTTEGFDFSISPLRGGRAPELDDVEVLEEEARRQEERPLTPVVTLLELVLYLQYLEEQDQLLVMETLVTRDTLLYDHLH
jgi:Ser/Thr protein kinase RdoA (MazF antagonist)